jgi:hypothetical protein
VVFMEVREENGMNGRQILEVNGGVGDASCRHAWTEMDMVARVEEVRVYKRSSICRERL